MTTAPLELAPDPDDVPPTPAQHAARAVTRAATALEAIQRADGSFECLIDVGPVAVATQLVLEDFAGRLSPDRAAAGRRALARTQRGDGSYPAWAAGPSGSVAVTALAVAALRVAGAPADDQTRAAAQAYVDAHGGALAVAEAFTTRGDSCAIFLAASGDLPPDVLPAVPLSLLAAPLLERATDGRLHAGNLMVLFVIAAVSAAKRPPPRRPGLLRAVVGTAVRELERRRAVDYLQSWQNPDGSFNQSVFATQLMALGLAALGRQTAGDAVDAALRWLDAQVVPRGDAITMQAIPNDVWGTAQASLALLAAGRTTDDPALARALAHLRAEQLHEPQPRANQRKRGAVRAGGWAFQRGNPTMPDCDDTGMVLASLGAATPPRASREEFATLDAGVAWLRAMQNPDGGWPAYVWNLPAKAPGPMFTNAVTIPDARDLRAIVSLFVDPPPELGDPSTEGVTGRVLAGLGACGIDRDDAAVCRALEFLQAQQCDSGAFWDRWMTCYLPGTATVLIGLAAVGADLRAPWVQRALQFLCTHQNADGGFGEDPRAFVDPRAAGQGPSMPPVTGYVLSALVAGGLRGADTARRAAAYLVGTQRADGTWGTGGWVNPYVPPDTFYTYDLAATTVPLQALAQYATGR